MLIVVVVAFQTLKKNNQYQKKNIGLVQRPCNSCLFLDVYKRGPREYQTTSFHVHDFSLHHHTTAAVGKGFVVWKERRGIGKDQYTCDGCEVQSPTWNTAQATNMEHNKATVEKEQCTHATDVKSKDHRGTQQRRRTWNTTKRQSRKSSVHMRQCKYCTASLPSNL